MHAKRHLHIAPPARSSCSFITPQLSLALSRPLSRSSRSFATTLLLTTTLLSSPRSFPPSLPRETFSLSLNIREKMIVHSSSSAVPALNLTLLVHICMAFFDLIINHYCPKNYLLCYLISIYLPTYLLTQMCKLPTLFRINWYVSSRKSSDITIPASG